jgi:hypothetical protein
MIIIAILLIPQLFFISVQANPLTTVTISLQGDPPCVDVSPGSPGIAVVNGEVRCTKYGPDPVEAYLIAESETGGASVVPPNFVFSGSTGTTQTDTFSVTTRVPMGCSCSTTPTITVGGSYSQGISSDTITPVSTIIIILQYYDVEVSSEKGFNLTASSGEDVNLDFKIHNAGNGNDIFLIDFMNRDAMEDKGFKLPEPLEIRLPEKATESLSMNIGVPEDKSGGFFLVLSVSSKGSEQSIFDVLVVKEIYLEVKGQSIAEKIGSFFLSPLLILIIVILVVIAIIIKWKRG